MTTAVAGEEYKLLKQTPKLVKMAKLFSLVWILAVTVPAVWFTYKNADGLKEYAVVAAVDTARDVMTEQYKSLTDKAIAGINIEKYTADITVPDIKLDKIDETAKKIKKATAPLKKFGIKDVAKLEESVDSVQKQVDKVNKQLKTTTAQVKSALSKQVQDGLKKEVSGLADTQIKKQLALSKTAYADLVGAKYGFATEKDRQITHKIYAELAKNNNALIKQPLQNVEKYYNYAFYAVIALIIIVTLIPPFIVKKLAKKFSAVYTQCPHCNKIFITKGNAFNLLKMLKIW